MANNLYAAYGDSNDWQNNSAYSKYAKQSGKGWGNSTLTFAQKKRRANEALARQTWRAQDIYGKTMGHARDESFGAIARAREHGLAGYESAYGRMNNYGNWLTDAYDNFKPQMDKWYDDARGRYEPIVGFGDDARNWLYDNIQDPRAYEQFMTGSLNSEYYDELARKQAEREANARGSLGVMAQAGINEAERLSAANREREAYSRLGDTRNYMNQFRQAGDLARQAQSNIDTGQAAARQNLLAAEIGDRGQLATNLSQMDLSKGNFLGNLAGMEGQVGSSYWSNMANMGRGDFDWWRGQEVADLNWTRNALYQDMVRNQMLDAQAEQSKMSGLNSLFGGLTKLALAPTTGGGSLFSSFFGA